MSDSPTQDPAELDSTKKSVRDRVKGAWVAATKVGAAARAALESEHRKKSDHFYAEATEFITYADDVDATSPRAAPLTQQAQTALLQAIYHETREQTDQLASIAAALNRQTDALQDIAFQLGTR